MKKTAWKSLSVGLSVGQTVSEKEITLDRGERIVTAIATNEMPGQIVNLGFYENGNEISVPVDLSFHRKSNAGQYLDGFRPVEFKGGAGVTARLTTLNNAPYASATDKDLEVQVVFGIIKEDDVC